MSSIGPLLQFPSYNAQAFTALKPSLLSSSAGDGSGSPVEPPRKQARTSSAGAGQSRLLSEREGGVRRIIVRGAAGYPHDPRAQNVNSNTDRDLLRRTILTLLQPRPLSNPPSLPPLPSFRTLSLACESLVSIQRAGAQVYSDVQAEIERAVGLIGRELGEERPGIGVGMGMGTRAKGVEWLGELVGRREAFDKALGLVRSFLLHVDQTYVLHEAPDNLPVRELGRQIFKEKILQNSEVQARIQAGIEDFLEQERASPDTPTPHRALFAPLSHILLTLNMYPLLLQPYITSTTSHYSTYPSSVPHSTPEEAIAYLQLASLKITQELALASLVLSLGGGSSSIRQAAEQALLGSGLLEHLSKLVLPRLLSDRSLDLLKLVHHLAGRVGAMNVLRVQFTAALADLVGGVIDPSPPSAERDEEMVPSLLSLRKFSDSLVDAFSHPSSASSSSGSAPDPEAQRLWRTCITDAFEKGFARRSKKPAEMIAKYIDAAMRRGQRGVSDEEFEGVLEEALGLYRFTKDRDVFREFYIRALAKRLLLQKSASDDFEMNVLKILINHDKFFEKGHGMFSDLALSRDMMREWQNQRADKGLEEEPLNVMVLQHSNWPTYTLGQVILPKHMERSLASFVTFYKSKHAQRKLDWAHSLGTVTLTARFDAGTKELSVSLYQAVVLLLFEDGGSLGFQDIKDATGIEDKELRRTLQSLALGRKRVLTKVPASKEVNDSDVFEYNAKFTDKNRRLHINSIQQTETAEEAKQIAEHIEEDRTHALDAAIVRIMKARKRLNNNKLTEEVILAVRAHFVPQPAQIKKQIESLIERDYLTRSDGDRNTFEYVA